jgi:hypothetical protein
MKISTFPTLSKTLSLLNVTEAQMPVLENPEESVIGIIRGPYLLSNRKENGCVSPNTIKSITI